MSNTFQMDGVAPEDAEIIQASLDGVQESEKEATDQKVARMLEEERKAGRGVEQHEQDDEDGEAQASDDDAAKEEAPKTDTKESDSQRRRRLRREAATRSRMELARANQKIGALQERLKKVEEKNPDPELYGDDTASYVGDRAGYAAQHVAATERLEEAQAEAKAHQQALEQETAQEMADFFSEGVRKHPDFDKVLRADGLAFTPAMVEAIVEDGLHDLAYELAKQPQEVARIASLSSPILQVKEILRAQAALEAKAAESKTTKAPPPIKPIRAAGATTAKSPSEMTMAEYTEWRRKSMARA